MKLSIITKGKIKFNSDDSFEIYDYRNSFLLQKKTNRLFKWDARIKKHIFEPGYDRLSEFRKLRKKYKMDITFQSLQSKRLGL